MKKIYGIIVISVFLLSSFLAMNMYTGTSFPGFGGSETCNNCHNQPAFVKNVDVSFAMNNFTAGKEAIESNAIFAADEVPVIQTNNRSDANLEFIKMYFMKNTTHVMVMAEITDSTPSNSTSSTSDKFGIIFNIDVVNFTVGDFLNNYNSSETDLNLVLDGQMGFNNGHADLWYVDTKTTGFNTSGLAEDSYITSAVVTDGPSNQDVHYSLWYGITAVHGSTVVHGYRIIFVRSLSTNDDNDVQFTSEGTGINYAIASWDNSQKEFHHSSFDQMVIVGDHIGAITQGTVVSNVTLTVTESASITSSLSAFSVVFVLAGLAIAIPVITYFRPKKL